MNDGKCTNAGDGVLSGGRNGGIKGCVDGCPTLVCTSFCSNCVSVGDGALSS